MKQDMRDGKIRLWAYALVAAIALLTGIFLGQLGDQSPSASRANWPHAER